MHVDVAQRHVVGVEPRDVGGAYLVGVARLARADVVAVGDRDAPQMPIRVVPPGRADRGRREIVVALVRLPPELHAVLVQHDQLALGGGDDVNVGREGVGELVVDPVGHRRIVVAGQNHDGPPDARQQLARRLDVGPLDPHVVEEVAGDHHHIDFGLFAQVQHVLKGAQRRLELAALAPRLGGVRAQMHIGGVQQPQRMRRRAAPNALMRRIQSGGHAGSRSPVAAETDSRRSTADAHRLAESALLRRQIVNSPYDHIHRHHNHNRRRRRLGNRDWA